MSTYVYAITRASHPLELRGGVGVGETPEPLRTVQDQELAAVLSDAPENLRAKRRDLQAHEEVLEARLAGASRSLPNRIATDKDTVERDLIKLVLTIVELLRQLMERQAMRRVDQEDLTDDQEERIGMTLMLLEDRMTQLRERYDLSVEDLNLDLGPLGSLLPR